MKVGIAGGGSVGSLLAWRLAKAGAKVDIFDAGASGRCGNASAGMICPIAELASAEPKLSRLGMDSLRLWQLWLRELDAQELLVMRGSILAAHRRDVPELERQLSLIASKLSDPDAQIVELDQNALEDLEPELGHLSRAYYFPNEGHIDTERLLTLLRKECMGAGSWHDDVKVKQVLPGCLVIGDDEYRYDWTCDCRGLGANDTKLLRSVRGEIIHLTAPEVNLTRPIRLAHPRYPVYVVPRDAQRYLVGATEIESADRGGVTARSAIELLSAACSVHTGFSEAVVSDLRVGLRPTTAEQMPYFVSEQGKVAINGMYRHGFMAGPALVERAVSAINLH